MDMEGKKKKKRVSEPSSRRLHRKSPKFIHSPKLIPTLLRKSSKLIPRRSKLRDRQVEKKLYVFFQHPGGNLTHSLYALDVPTVDSNTTTNDSNLGHTTTTTTTTLVTTTGRTTTTSTVVGDDPPRTPVDPVLCFDDENWPKYMSCACLGNRLFFVGGAFMGESLTTNVFVLDLTSFSSLDELRSYQNRPMEILKPGPNLHTGKVYQDTFVVGHTLYVLSGQRYCPYTSLELNQLEYLDSTDENPQWQVASNPPFEKVLLEPYVVLDDRVIVSGSQRGTGDYVIYSYHFKEDRWSEFDRSGWTQVTKDLGFFFCSGSQWMGNKIYSSYVRHPDAIPVIIRLQEEDELVVLPDDEVHDVVRHTILGRHLSCTLVRLTGTQIGFLQVGNPPSPSGKLKYFNPEETHLSLSISDAFAGEGRGGKSVPKYLTSAHFVTYPGRTFIIDNAFMV